MSDSDVEPEEVAYFVEPTTRAHLKRFAPEVYEELTPCAWPPAGWTGAEEDAALALKIAELLKPAVESSDIDSEYFAFVVAPNDSHSESFDDEPDNEVFINIDEEDRESAAEEHGEDEWWREYWEEAEYSARAKASAHMVKTLKAVWRDDMETSSVTSAVFYQGYSKTGAIVGVFAIRSDS